MDAGAYAIAALGLATLRLGRSHVRARRLRPGPARHVGGFAYLRADRPLRTLVVVVAVMVAFTNVSVIAELFLARHAARRRGGLRGPRHGMDGGHDGGHPGGGAPHLEAAAAGGAARHVVAG